jgi:hypothetical protein
MSATLARRALVLALVQVVLGGGKTDWTCLRPYLPGPIISQNNNDKPAWAGEPRSVWEAEVGGLLSVTTREQSGRAHTTHLQDGWQYQRTRLSGVLQTAV